MTASRLLKTLLRQNAKYYILALIFTIFRTMAQFATPAILAELIDHHLGDGPSRFPALLNRGFDRLFGPGYLAQNLWLFGVMIVLISIISGVAFYFRGTLTTKGSQNAAQHLRNRMYDHIQHLPFDYHVKVETGDLLQRCTSDIDTIRRFLSDQVVSLLYSFFMVIIALALMLPINPGITLLSLSITPVIFLFSMYFFRLVSQSFRKSDEAEAVMSTVSNAMKLTAFLPGEQQEKVREIWKTPPRSLTELIEKQRQMDSVLTPEQLNRARPVRRFVQGRIVDQMFERGRDRIAPEEFDKLKDEVKRRVEERMSGK